jgi:HAD superfamily hydrolase (TIGR01493 family)
MAKAVMFDFSGTLFRCEDTRSRLRAVLAARGIEAGQEELADAAHRLQSCGAIPGIPASEPIPAHLSDIWARRDLTSAEHRSAHLALMRSVRLPWPDLEDAVYDRQFAPQAWHAYPDTGEVLRQLRDRGIPVAVLSNIVWDLQPTFEHHGLDQFVSRYVLSYREGVMKPDPRIFARACELLGQAPGDVLMVGDDAVADGGAAALGCEFQLVAHAPVEQRPRALLDAVHALL